MAINVMDTMVTSARHEVVTATAVMTACEWMRRWNALTSWRPVNAARQVSRITANVVTRMPPAVEVLPPPMNMTMDRNTFVASLTPGIHDRSKPELRGMTAATIACHNRGSTPSVANSSLLFHSMRRNQVNEASTMQNVVVSVSLVCRLQRFGGRWLRHERMRLSRTGKPSVPQNALTRIGRPTAQLLTCRPAPSGVKPALLYAMTAKNNDSHSVCRTLP